MNPNDRAKCRVISAFKSILLLARSKARKARLSRLFLAFLTAGLVVWPVIGTGQISDTLAGNQTAAGSHTIMQPDDATMLKWFRTHEGMPKAPMAPKSALLAPGGSISLLSHLDYVPAQRNQGSCGDCWCWAGHGCLEILLHIQTGIFDRLSVQEMNSCETAVIGMTCCAGGWLSDLQDFYRTAGYQRVVPWSNPGANWQDGDASCDTTCASITTTPNYPVQSITAHSITTRGVGQAQAIANIKAILNQNKPVAFAFFMATQNDWNTFFSTWYNQAESTTVNFDYACGHANDSGYGGHEVLCVGYNDDNPNDPYWIMVNSWGTTAYRPNGIFHVKMNNNYDCTWTLGAYTYPSYYWEYLDVTYTTTLTITQQPQSTTVCAGANATFSVTATGSVPLSYQWQTNSVNLVNGGHYSGVTTPNLTVTAADSGVATSYRCLVSNAGGSVTSTVATLTVNARPTAAVSGSATISNGGTTTIQAVLTGMGPWNLTWSDGNTQNGVAGSPAIRIVSPSATTTYTVTALSDARCTAQAGDLTGNAVVTVNSQTPFQTWQLNYFGCTNCSQAADSADPDGDGSANLQEFLTGTDPTNGVSCWRIQASPTNGLSSLMVSFTENSTGSSITNRLWNFGDGGTGSGANPSHTYTNVGTFSVGLTILNKYGTATLVATNLITVSSAPSTILADAGDLQDRFSTLAPSNSVAVLVVDTGNNGFTDLQPGFPLSLGGTWGTDDRVVGLWDLSTAAAEYGDGQLFDQTVVTYANGIAPGQKLQLYWLPSLTLASNTLGVTYYGKYTDTNSPTLDGSDVWQIPPGGSSVHLKFWTAAWGGSNSQTAGFATLFTGAQIAVNPTNALVSAGGKNGPFNPVDQIYALTNTGGASLTWAASKSQSWVSLSATSGVLSVGASTNVTVSVSAAANSLAAGSYSDTVTFTNTTNGIGTTNRSVILTVNQPTPATIVADAGDLQDRFGTLAPVNSVAVLVVDTGNNGFVDPQPSFPLNLGTTWGADDKVVGLWDLNACNCGDGQLFDQTVVAYTNAVAPGQKLQLYWFPSLMLASNTLGVTYYGKYTDTNSPALDGSDAWQIPPGGSSVHLKFWTAAWGGSNPQTAGLATLLTAGNSLATWQQQYFGCTACPEAAEGADPDGDGQNNLAEFLAGTVPTNSASAFRITAVACENNNLRVTWAMGSDKTNTLQVTTGTGDGSYSTNSFSDIFTVTNTVGTRTNYLDVGAATFPSRFYRVRLVP